MATKFKKGEEVRVNAVIPQGPVTALRMDEDGNFFYQIQWTDVDGVQQNRWFREEELVAV
jgi:uncharacterized protein YodC (DUF2158 family)